MTKIYKVQFEVFHLAFFFHPFCVVEANDISHSKERGLQVFRSHPNNVDLDYKIVEITESSAEEHPDYIRIDEEMPWQPEEDGE